MLDDGVAVLRGAVRAAVQRAREDAPRPAEHARERVEVVHHEVDADAAGARGSIIQSFQAGGGESRCALAASGRPSSPERDDAPQLDVLGPEAQDEADDEQPPRAPAAASIACASSSVSAIGFSSSTCLPAAKARSAASRCCGVGRQMSTTSTSSRSSGA